MRMTEPAITAPRMKAGITMISMFVPKFSSSPTYLTGVW